MKIIKPLGIFTFGGLAYGLLEIFWRGQTHISMFVVGGLCFLMISVIDSLPAFGGSLLLEAPICALGVTAAELVSGVIVNMSMGLEVWDYSDMPLNLWGQICLPFSAIWLALAIPAAIASRLLKHFVFEEELPVLRLLPQFQHAAAEEG